MSHFARMARVSGRFGPQSWCATRSLLQLRHSSPDARAPKRRSLYFEGLPRLEMKFIRRAPCPRRPAPASSPCSERRGGEYLRPRCRWPVRPGERFSIDARESSSSIRGVILGSADASVFTADQQRMLADFVTVRGGGLLAALGGEESFAEGRLARDASVVSPANRFRSESQWPFSQTPLTVNVQPTDEGIRSSCVADCRRQTAGRSNVAAAAASHDRQRRLSASWRREILLTGTDRVVESRWFWLFNNTARAALWRLHRRTRGCG